MQKSAVYYYYKGEPVCRPDPPSRRFPPRGLTCRDLRKHPALCQHQPWLLLDSSLFCCPSITAQALRAAIAAAELPLRGKLRAETTIFSIDQRILEMLYQCLHTLLRDYIILGWRPRIAPCSTRGHNCRGKPRVFCWVLTSDLESGGARCAPFLDPRTFPIVLLRAVRLPLVELAIIVRIQGRFEFSEGPTLKAS